MTGAAALAVEIPAQRSATAAALLSFVAGFTDTVGFVALFGLFTAHVTGNFVLLGAALIRSHNGLLAKFLALPVFIAAVSASTMYVRTCERQRRPALAVLTLMQMLLLTGFSLAGIAASPVTDADAPLAVLAGLLGVCAMGVQNASARLLLADLPPTTVMTGNVTQFAVDVTHLLRRPLAADAAMVRSRVVRLAPPVLCFAAGAAAGALLYHACGFSALLVPVAALCGVLWLRQAPELRA